MGFGDRVRQEGSNLSASTSQARGPYASHEDAHAAARPGMAGICINMICTWSDDGGGGGGGGRGGTPSPAAYAQHDESSAVSAPWWTGARQLRRAAGSFGHERRLGTQNRAVVPGEDELGRAGIVG